MVENSGRTILITGGAGFVGSNLAERLLAEPDTQVRIFDNLSRPGVSHNLDWLRSLAGPPRLEIMKGDIRDADAVRGAAAGVSDIYHLAAQVAVTDSVKAPALDFEINARGTLNVLEAARSSSRSPFLLFTSTNKVYGSLSRLLVEVRGQRYCATAPGFCGVNETEPLDFHSPYGCSKGTADQYVRDYSRIYGLRTVVFRMSCIAGPRQFGTEDQGWVAHLLYSALAGRDVTIYGDGFQVRDVLHVHDLIDAMQLARLASCPGDGAIFNVGGGIKRSVSVSEMLKLIEEETGKSSRRRHREVRPGDQPLFVTDSRKLEKLTGWKPRHSIKDTLKSIHQFWTQNRALLSSISDLPTSSSQELQMEVA